MSKDRYSLVMQSAEPRNEHISFHSEGNNPQSHADKDGAGGKQKRHYYILNTFADLPRLPFDLAQSVSKKGSALVLLVFALFLWFVLVCFKRVACGFCEFGFIVLEHG